MLWVLLAARFCWCFWPMMLLQPFIHSVVSFLWAKLSSSLYKYTIPQWVLQEFRCMLLSVIFENFYLFLQSYFTSSFSNETQEWGPHLTLIQLPPVGLRAFHQHSAAILACFLSCGWIYQKLRTTDTDMWTCCRFQKRIISSRKEKETFFLKGNVAYSHSMWKLKCCSHSSKK